MEFPPGDRTYYVSDGACAHSELTPEQKLRWVKSWRRF